MKRFLYAALAAVTIAALSLPPPWRRITRLPI